MKQRIETVLCLCVSIMLFGLAVVFGRACASDVHEEIRAVHLQSDADALISAAESQAIADVVRAERQYEQMDYEFFNGDAEAYPLKGEAVYQ